MEQEEIRAKLPAGAASCSHGGKMRDPVFGFES